jgi:hypothetical protein
LTRSLRERPRSRGGRFHPQTPVDLNVVDCFEVHVEMADMLAANRDAVCMGHWRDVPISPAGFASYG